MTARKPTERKRLAGNAGKRALPEPIAYLPPAIGTPEAPVSLAEHGVQAWQRIWRSCSAWISPDTDIALVTRYCELYDIRQELRRTILDEGFTAPTDKGGVKPHPLLTALRDSETQLTRYEQLMGLTPTDRAKLGLVEVKKQTGIEDYLTKAESRQRRQKGE